MVRIVLRDEDNERLNKLSEELSAAINEAIQKTGVVISMKGPMPCAISRIAGYYRNQIVMSAASPDVLQKVLAEARAAGALGKTDKIAVDVDPVSLL
jgi:primosomal protein N'